MDKAAQVAHRPGGSCRPTMKERIMSWTTPVLVEICIGLEINGYLPAEF
jgi:coenzyme PQQ precursor peptide PqqA